MRHSGRTAVILAAALIAAPAITLAQEPVRDFSQLNTRLTPGDTIWVTDAQGREVKGRILSLGADELTLEGGGGRTFGAPDVRAIDVRRADSLENGAFIGMGVGGGLALTACLIAGSGADDGEAGWCAVAVAFYAGAGAGLGVVIDAMIPGKKLVAYRAPGSAGPSHARLSIAPVVTPRAKGLALAFSF